MSTACLTPYEMASLRIQAFSALAGTNWGQVRNDGKWTAWSYDELRSQADILAYWSVPTDEVLLDCKPIDAARFAIAADFGLRAEP